ncbi:MAG: hypothetical protein ABL998_05255 [Planctomycetota bacterium]
MRRSSTRSARRGAMLVETLIAVTLFATVLLSSMAMVESGKRFSSSTLQITSVEDLSQQMLFRLEHELASAAGAEPIFSLSAPLAAGTVDSMAVSSTRGFPPRGELLLERGTGLEERLGYGTIASLTAFGELTRGLACTAAAGHAANNGVDHLWAGLAQPLDNQVDPSASEYDGIALEGEQPMFFRGDGTGFSFRIPVDPDGGNNPLDGDDLRWGAVVPGVGPTTDGWMALVYEPKGVYEEALHGDDLNKDGDTLDVFDVGQIRRLTWDTTDPGQLEDLGLGPSQILQERCNRGGDLDGDGFDDPLFLWDGDRNLLHVRLYVLGASRADMPVVRKVESVLFLRNEAAL